MSKNAPAPETPAPETKTYLVNWTLNHNNTIYELGDTVEMTEKEAAPLLGGVLSLNEK